jgi:hypothetical protein
MARSAAASRGVTRKMRCKRAACDNKTGARHLATALGMAHGIGGNGAPQRNNNAANSGAHATNMRMALAAAKSIAALSNIAHGGAHQRRQRHRSNCGGSRQTAIIGGGIIGGGVSAKSRKSQRKWRRHR